MKLLFTEQQLRAFTTYSKLAEEASITVKTVMTYYRDGNLRKKHVFINAINQAALKLKSQHEQILRSMPSA